MSAPQFARWRAFDTIEPIGGRRDDWQAASICAMVMNAAVLMRTGKSKLIFQPKDFLIDWGGKTAKEGATQETPRTPAWQQMKLIAQMHAALANADKNKRVWRK